MKFGFKNLDPETEYRVIDVDTARYDPKDKTHKLRAVLSYIKNGEALFEERYANIQFGRQLRIGVTWIGDKAVRSKEIIVANLPYWFGRTSRYCEDSIDYLDESSLHFGRFHYRTDNPPAEYYNYRCLVHELNKPFDINGTNVDFIMVSTYELTRYFVFGVNKYNELLLKGLVFDQSQSNNIYNPEITREITVEGKKRRFVQLRSKVPDSCVQLVGDLFFEKRVREMAQKFVHSVSVNKNPFYISRFPIENVRNIKAYGRFVKNKAGKTGFEVLAFASVDYGKKYLFSRDNDGRTTAKRDQSMTKIFGGKKKNAIKKPIKDPINHDALGDKDLESTPLHEYIEENQFEDGDLSGEKVVKVDQSNIADKKTPGDEIDGRGVGAASDNGGTGSGTVPVNNDCIVGADDITSSKYWDRFTKIIEGLLVEFKDYSVSVRYLSKGLEFVNEPSISSFKNVLNVQSLSEFYLVEFNVGMHTFYIMEVNPNEYDVPTMIFWDAFASTTLLPNQIEIFLTKYFDENGVSEQVAEAILEEFEIGHTIINHQYHPRGSNGDWRYPAEKALSNQSKKIATKIKKEFF